MSRVRQAFGVEIPLRRLFDRPTVAGFATAIAEALAGRELVAPPLRPVGREGPLPLSFAQQRLWFIDQLDPDSPAYNIPAAFRMTGRLNRAALASGLAAIVHRHEALRTSFADVGDVGDIGGAAGVARQVIAPEAPFSLPSIDLSALPAAPRQLELARLVRAAARQPFDLARGPLLRARLVRLAEGEQVLLFAMHHIVSDGWSLGVLVRELDTLYRAFVAGRPSPLPPLPVQYADFALWQRHYLNPEVMAAEVAWWRERLAGVPPVLELPADRPRPALPSLRGAALSFALPAGLRAGCAALARASGATRFMTFLALFETLLARLSGQGTVAVGSPIANRTRLETEGLIGFFVNTLVLATDLSGDPSFRTVLGRVRETTLGAYAHQDLPFEQLVAELQPERSLAHSPLFQAMFAFQDGMADLRTLDWPDLTLERLPFETRMAMFDLSLTWAEGGEELRGGLEYSLDLFDATTARRMAAHLEVLTAAAVAAPDCPISELPLLSAAERQALLAEWQEPALPTREARCLHQLFETRAALQPRGSRPGHGGGEELTYGELDRRANHLAGHLRRRGVGPEVPVGVCLPRSLELIVALLAVSKAGGVYLPLDPAYPRERLAYMLADSGAPWVLTAGPWLAHLPSGPAASAGRLLIEELEAEPAVPAPHQPGSPAFPGALAYLIYTSGSTGRPKGVGVEQGIAVRHLEATGARFGLGPGDRFSHFVSPSFDIALEEILAPLLSGATVVVHGAELWEPEQILARAAELALTVLSLPTALWARWVRELGPAEPPPNLPLRLVLVGGEAMPVEAVGQWFETPLAHLPLWNGYGPTEAVITATWWQAEPRTALSLAAAPIGRPLAGHSAHLLAGGQPAPLGVSGELYLGGLLGRGYLGNPAATAERYLPDPFAAEPGARLYRTGDLVRRLPDGELQFLGRTDGQVKIRGFRIELGEIEAVLAEHPGVAEAVVVVAAERPGEPYLAAYLVPAKGELPGREELRELLRARLPEYMCPALFVSLPALPLTPNGKVDRQALAELRPAEERGGEARSAAFAAPRTPIEEQLAAIWRQLLGRERVGIDDSFFDLGGHSLLATQAMSRVRNTFAVELPLRTLFEAPTIAGLAREIESVRGPAPSAALPAAAPPPPLLRAGEAAELDGLPLSFAQERLWFLDQLDPGSADLQHPGGPKPARPARGGRVGSEPRRDRSPARRVAHHLLGSGREGGGGRRDRPAGAIDRAVDRLGDATDRPRRPPGRAPRSGAAAAGRGGGEAPLRSRPRAPPARRSPPSGGGRARPPVHDAPCRLRRLVLRGADPRAGGALRQPPRWRAVAPPGAAAPVPRLRPLAARLPRRRGPRTRAGLLAGRARGPSDPRPPHRPATAAGAARAGRVPWRSDSLQRRAGPSNGWPRAPVPPCS